MADVLLSTEDVTVVGGPSSVSLSLDIGATGDPGSMIYYGVGNPNSSSTVLGFVPKLLDMYINLDTTDSEYQYLYQYQNVAGVDEWSPLFRMFTNTYRKNIPTGTAVFVDGQTDLFIRILDILPADIAETSSPEDFNIQYSILGDHPIISSIVVAGEYSVIASEKHLKISVNAAEKQNGNFVDLQGGRVIHLFITVV
jgi:hypothetical protein